MILGCERCCQRAAFWEAFPGLGSNLQVSAPASQRGYPASLSSVLSTLLGRAGAVPERDTQQSSTRVDVYSCAAALVVMSSAYPP